MIRDRLKNAAIKVARRAFGMQWEAEEVADYEGNTKRKVVPQNIDLSVIPRVVDGSGDTPGPKHLEKIGRTWLASQVASNVSPVLIDIRHPKECAGGILPGAHVLPGDQIKSRLDVLPAKDIRVSVYDQTGSPAADAVAIWLREQGWGLARYLEGGYAEWIEHDEPIVRPEPVEGGRYFIGSPVETKGVGKGKKSQPGKRGVVQKAYLEAGAPRYVVLFDDGTVGAGLGEDELTA